MLMSFITKNNIRGFVSSNRFGYWFSYLGIDCKDYVNEIEKSTYDTMDVHVDKDIWKEMAILFILLTMSKKSCNY